MTFPTIDAHQHIWDPTRYDYSWLGPQFAPIDRSFAFEESHDDLVATGVTASVLVQAADHRDDTDLMLEAAERDARIVGVVGWLPIEHPDAVAVELDSWAGSSLHVGARTLIHDQPDADYLLRPAVLESLGVLEARGVPFDVVAVLPRHLEIVGMLAERFPRLTLVIDHLGHPPVGAPDDGTWAELFRRAAQHPHVVAKLSGLYSTTGALDSWTTETLRPAVERALDVFGPERLLYGGDWPVSILAGGYRRVWEGLQPLLAQLSDDEREGILGRTAARVYGLDAARLAAAEVAR